MKYEKIVKIDFFCSIMPELKFYSAVEIKHSAKDL